MTPPDHLYYLFHLELKEKDANFHLQALIKEIGQDLSIVADYDIHTLDYDTKTDKVYFAYDQSNYVQIKGLPFEQIEVARKSLEKEYLYLSGEQIPQQARTEAWPIHENHCIQRILLDRLFDDKWNHHLKKKNKAAYKQLSNVQLGRLLFLTYQLMEEGKPLAQVWNESSLNYRSK